MSEGMKAWQMPDGAITVQSFVDAQNGFGAMIRTSFACKVGPENQLTFEIHR